MEEKKETLPPIIDQLKEYAETRVKLAKYQAIEGGSTVAASVIADTLTFLSFVLAFIFASCTLGYYLGDVLGATWKGFGCVALLYLIIAVILKATKQKLERPLANKFVAKFFKN
jgi:hypothetical protein